MGTHFQSRVVGRWGIEESMTWIGEGRRGVSMLWGVRAVFGVDTALYNPLRSPRVARIAPELTDCNSSMTPWA
jgi:hypothetical protein